MESIKQEIGEELEKNELKPIEYDKDNLIEEVDDSWIRLEDKLLLFKLRNKYERFKESRDNRIHGYEAISD